MSFIDDDEHIEGVDVVDPRLPDSGHAGSRGGGGGSSSGGGQQRLTQFWTAGNGGRARSERSVTVLLPFRTLSPGTLFQNVPNASQNREHQA